MENYEWHVDGHSLVLKIIENSLDVSASPCPLNDSPEAPCYSASIGKCGIRHFLDTYGLMLNVGECDPAPVVEIAWTHNGWKEWSLYETTVHIIPVEDPVFKSWLKAQTQL